MWPEPSADVPISLPNAALAAPWQKSGLQVAACAAAVVAGVITAVFLMKLGETAFQALRPPGDLVNWLSVPRWVREVLAGYFYFYCFAVIVPFVAFLGWRALARPAGVAVETPFVSIIIPAYNEEAAIERAVTAALAQDYPAFEVIVVDDGSSDFTRYAGADPRARFVHLERNGGKAAAINAGLVSAAGEIVVCSDGDSFLAPDALRQIVRCLVLRDVAAVAGRVVIGGPPSFLRDLQEVEYVFGQELVKSAQVGSTGLVTVCPGPICAYRRSVLRVLGGFSGRTLTEDFDMTLEVIAAGYRVAYQPRAIAHTDPPRTWRQLGRQRLRWYRGALQVFRQHPSLMMTPAAGGISLFWLPYQLIFSFGTMMLEMAALATYPAILWACADPLGILASGIVFLLFIELFIAVQQLLVLCLAGSLRPRLVLAAIFSKPYWVFLAVVRLRALAQELKGVHARW